VQYLKQEQQDTERRLGTPLGRSIFFARNKGKLKTSARSARLAAGVINDLIGNARTFKFFFFFFFFFLLGGGGGGGGGGVYLGCVRLILFRNRKMRPSFVTILFYRDFSTI